MPWKRHHNVSTTGTEESGVPGWKMRNVTTSKGHQSLCDAENATTAKRRTIDRVWLFFHCRGMFSVDTMVGLKSKEIRLIEWAERNGVKGDQNASKQHSTKDTSTMLHLCMCVCMCHGKFPFSFENVEIKSIQLLRCVAVCLHSRARIVFISMQFWVDGCVAHYLPITLRIDHFAFGHINKEKMCNTWQSCAGNAWESGASGPSGWKHTQV